MLYSIVGQDVADSLAGRKEHRPAHLARLQALASTNRLLVAGPNPSKDCSDLSNTEFTGSVVIAEFESLEAAQQWASQDPYLLNGVYQSVSVKPFVNALP